MLAQLVDNVADPKALKHAAMLAAKGLADGTMKVNREPKGVQKLLRRVLEETEFGRNFVFKKAREMVMKQTKGVYPAPLKVCSPPPLPKNKSQPMSRAIGTQLTHSLSDCMCVCVSVCLCACVCRSLMSWRPAPSTGLDHRPATMPRQRCEQDTHALDLLQPFAAQHTRVRPAISQVPCSLPLTPFLGDSSWCCGFCCRRLASLA